MIGFGFKPGLDTKTGATPVDVAAVVVVVVFVLVVVVRLFLLLVVVVGVVVVVVIVGVVVFMVVGIALEVGSSEEKRKLPFMIDPTPEMPCTEDEVVLLDEVVFVGSTPSG